MRVSGKRVMAAGVLSLASLTACGTTVQLGAAGTTAQAGGSIGLDGSVTENAGSTTGEVVVGQSVTSGGTEANRPATTTAQPLPSAEGSSEPDPASTSPVGVVGPAGTARGVTAKAIKVGVFTVQGFDTFASSVGVAISTGDQATQARAVINYINAHGGAAGRKLEPVFHDQSVSGSVNNYQGEMQAACAAFTQDNHVYAVETPVGTTGDTLYECLKKNSVIMVSGGESRDETFFQRYDDIFYQPSDMNLTRIFRDNVDNLYKDGWFGTKPKVGVVLADIETEHRAVDQGLKPALEAHGMKLADQAAISSSNSGSAEYSNAVVKFKAEGITHVMFSFAGSALLFGTNSAQQGYHPKFGLHSRSSPGALLQASTPSSALVGAAGIGWQQYNDVDTARDPGAPSARAKLCLKLMQDAGQDTSARATALIALWQCDNLFFLKESLDKAASFSLSGLRAGAEALSSFEAASTFRSSFGPGRTHDGARVIRMFAFDTSCSCFKYTSPRRPAA